MKHTSGSGMAAMLIIRAWGTYGLVAIVHSLLGRCRTCTLSATVCIIYNLQKFADPNLATTSTNTSATNSADETEWTMRATRWSTGLTEQFMSVQERHEIPRSFGAQKFIRSQMDINHKHIIFEPGKNIYFSTSSPPTLIPLSHLFASASKPAAAVSAISAPPFQPLHQRNICHVSRSSCEPLYMTNTSQLNRKYFFKNILLHSILLPTKNAQYKAALQ
jgi:hypothetical protein